MLAVDIDHDLLSNAVYNPLMIRLSRIFADLVINRDGQSFKRYLFGFILELHPHLAKGLELLNRVLLAIPNSNMSKCKTTKHCVLF